jgi:hypothetical protein
MQVEAIYSQGRLEFAQPMKLKHDHIRLVVNVPDEEIELDAGTGVATMNERVKSILAPYQHLLAQNKPLTPTDYKAIWREHLEEKHLNRNEKSDI